jgi:hypothetical protein
LHKCFLENQPFPSQQRRLKKPKHFQSKTSF